ncbi:insulin-like growth factor-binding protein complex acid labile subunit [Neodiprion virginianus]|uniref:insulin-like growth factor-binding protein complex acid labile subunit n=1 Tax=Neodiprion fabricii TaxID=2872261 RepID=UPI001ED95A5E|nr:insulin-like growth factor-binding protein complex acid labile subunit [Neodiprion fabricii]XP_046613386.1 insulin-like growth factor-binding protein complex acid labile subunit [Neodiprion virginianus]
MVRQQRFANGSRSPSVAWCVFILCLASFQLEVHAGCPERCLCSLDQVPSRVACEKRGLREFPDRISDLVQYLDLSGNILQEIPDTLTLFNKLQYLNLARNRLTDLPDKLYGLDQLQKLDLSGNAFTSVSGLTSISHLTSLKILFFGGNPISSLDGLMSQSLQVLDCSHCGIKAFANTTVSKLTQLRTLSLMGNPLRIVDKPVSESLRWLDMSDCQINYLYPDSLLYLPNLEELRLSNNPMLVFSTRFNTLTHNKLKRLDASRCNLDRPGLHGFPQLIIAKLNRNLIRFLPDQIFAKNTELRQISLAANVFDQVNKSAFAGLVKLEILDLSLNSLHNIHWAAFRENMNLRLLNLSHNSLLQFPNFTSSTTFLDLSGNLLDDFTNDVLLTMPKLKTLYLSNNRVDQIPDNLESHSLTTLSLRQNRVIQLTNQTFHLLPALERIDLSGNLLTVAPLPSVFEGNPSLQRILLDENPWRCDCELIYESYEFLLKLKANPLDLVCESPGNVSGFSWKMACNEKDVGFDPKDKTWGMILISLLTMVIVFGSVVSLRHAMKMKRQAHLERQELERAEARERLRLLQRRNRHEEDQLIEQSSEPRINPLELICPPSYEEAVHMPRLAHSMDALDSISMESVPTHILGSVDNLRSKKRRSRRPRKRAISDENLARREERREIRRRRISLERNRSTNDLGDSAQSPLDSTNELASSRSLQQRRPRPRSNSDDDAGSRTRPRPLTPAVRHKKRRSNARNGHSSDDEDSDVHAGILPAKITTNGIVIQTLTKEPRSGYRPTDQESDF